MGSIRSVRTLSENIRQQAHVADRIAAGDQQLWFRQVKSIFSLKSFTLLLRRITTAA